MLKNRLFVQLIKILGVFMLVFLLLVVVLLLNNNIAFRLTAQEGLPERLDRAILVSTEWLESRNYEVTITHPNCALLHMIDNMADISGETRLRQITDDFLRLSSTSPWRRMVDEDAEFRLLPHAKVAQYQDYQRWILYALAPDFVDLPEDDVASMFDDSAHYWGSLNHQLFSLYIYRKYQGNTPELEALVNHLCERVAFEGVWDFRVTDLYLQRVAFLLAAGRPDLVRRRWVERLLDKQESDGGWEPAWYGWGPDIFRFTLKRRPPDAHATVQGMWVVYMLKYRYPEWFEKQS